MNNKKIIKRLIELENKAKENLLKYSDFNLSDYLTEKEQIEYKKLIELYNRT